MNRKKVLPALPAAFLLLGSLAMGIRGQTGTTVIPLEGLDPIELINGKEVAGKMTISVTRGRFQYFREAREQGIL